jgi:hypothetical protein
MHSLLYLHLVAPDDPVPEPQPTPTRPPHRRRIRGALAALLARTAGVLDRDRAARALFPGW